jgi:hypothetical protein
VKPTLDRRLWKNASARRGDPDLLAHWKFENNSIDEVAGYTPTWENGSAQYTDGWGRAAKIDGSNNSLALSVSVIRCGDGPDLTCSFWHYPNNAGGANLTCARVDLSPTVYDFALTSQPTSPFVRATVYGQSGFYRAEPNPAGMAQVWNFVCMTWVDSTDTGVLYVGIDGAALQTTSLTDNSYVSPRNRQADGIRLGWQPTNESWLDDFRYYRVVKDVQALYDEGKTALGL